MSDFDRGAPELLRFCGLEWQEACRRFAGSDRIIATLSAVQARQPMTAFQGRRRRYARHLSPLLAALSAAGVDPHSTSSRHLA